MTAVSASALCLSTADFANAIWLKFPAASYQYLCMQIQKKKKKTQQLAIVLLIVYKEKGSLCSWKGIALDCVALRLTCTNNSH